MNSISRRIFNQGIRENHLRYNLIKAQGRNISNTSFNFNNNEGGNDNNTNQTLFESQDIIAREDGDLLVNAYSETSFSINGEFVDGSVFLLPRLAMKWHVSSVNDINIDTLSLAFLYRPKIKILIIGTGNSQWMPSDELKEYIRKRRIGLEVMPSHFAASTFNILNLESRGVAAALLANRDTHVKPPKDI